MLMPLQTLDGWPQVPEVSVLASLGIFVGFPLAVFVIVFAIAKLRPAKPAPGAPGSGQPLWVSGSNTAVPGAQHAAVEAGQPAADPNASRSPRRAAGESSPGEQPKPGGASARW